MNRTAAELSRSISEREYALQLPAIVLDPVDPHRRAKELDGIPAPKAGRTPNGTARRGRAVVVVDG